MEENSLSLCWYLDVIIGFNLSLSLSIKFIYCYVNSWTTKINRTLKEEYYYLCFDARGNLMGQLIRVSPKSEWVMKFIEMRSLTEES